MPAGRRFRGWLGATRAGIFALLSALVRVCVPRGGEGGCLVLKLDALGDQALWMSSGMQEVARFARASWSRTVLITRQELAPLHRELGLFDEIWPLDTWRFRVRPLYRTRQLVRLRQRGFSCALQMRIAREYLQEDAIIRAIAAPVSLAVLGDSHNLTAGQDRRSSRWYRPIYSVTASTPLHELERNRIAARILTGEKVGRLVTEWPRLAGVGLAPGYYVLAPGAGAGSRRWPAANFAEVARFLQRQLPALQGVVAGTSEEGPLGEQVARAAPILNLCGRLSILGLYQLIAHASLVVANESAAGHIAAQCGVPSLVVVGGGHFGWFMPYPAQSGELRRPQVVNHAMPCYGCNWHCPFTRTPEDVFPCIQNVTVAAVLSELSRCLGSSQRTE